jgi:hypothetical protein
MTSPSAQRAARSSPHIQLSSSAKADDAVFPETSMIEATGRGVLDHPPSRVIRLVLLTQPSHQNGLLKNLDPFNP